MNLKIWLAVIALVGAICGGFIYLEVQSDKNPEAFPNKARQENLQNKDKKPFKEFGEKMENRIDDAETTGKDFKTPTEVKDDKKDKNESH